MSPINAEIEQGEVFLRYMTLSQFIQLRSQAVHLDLRLGVIANEQGGRPLFVHVCDEYTARQTIHALGLQ